MPTDALTVYDGKKVGRKKGGRKITTEYDENVEEEIPGMLYVLAITTTVTGGEGGEVDDDETNIVVSNVNEYELPDAIVEGRKVSGGNCISALLEVLKKNNGGGGEGAALMKKKKKRNNSPTSMLTWAEALEGMQEYVQQECGMTNHIPTLSISRPIDVRNEPIRISSSSTNSGGGVKRALLIGIQYDDKNNDNNNSSSSYLSSCHNDLRKIRELLIHEHGFEKQNILVTLDDNGRHHLPTKKLILDSLTRLCEISEPGDSIFISFSGHGGRLEEDGRIHELLATSDYHKKGIGPIVDDELYASFVTKIPAGVECVAVIDPLHPPSSGGKSSVLELPYVCDAGDNEIYYTNGFSPGRPMIAAATGAGVATVNNKKKKKKKKDRNEKGETSGKKTKKDKKHNKKTRKKHKNKAIENDSDGDIEAMHDENSDDEEELGKRPKSKKRSKKKKKTKEVVEDDDHYSDEREKKSKKKKKNGVSKKKKEVDESESSIVDLEEEENSHDEKEEKELTTKKKQKKKGVFGLRQSSDYVDEGRSSDGEDEPKKKKKGLFGLYKNKPANKPDIANSDDEEDDDYESSADDKPKKKKKGLFGLRGRK